MSRALEIKERLGYLDSRCGVSGRLIELLQSPGADSGCRAGINCWASNRPSSCCHLSSCCRRASCRRPSSCCRLSSSSRLSSCCHLSWWCPGPSGPAARPGHGQKLQVRKTSLECTSNTQESRSTDTFSYFLLENSEWRWHGS